MASLQGDVTLALGDGREFTLVLDHEALLGIEDATGKPLPQVMAQAGEGFMTATAAIAAAAFSRHHPEITRADVLAMVMGDDAAPLTEALGKAAENAFPKASAEGKASVPGGKRSGRNGAKRG